MSNKGLQGTSVHICTIEMAGKVYVNVHKLDTI